VVAQQALLPQHTDPKLWLVHTKPGAEREAVQCLLQKGVDLALRGVPLQIKSAFTQDHLKVRAYGGALRQPNRHVGLHLHVGLIRRHVFVQISRISTGMWLHCRCAFACAY